jgi:lipopolysaccharide export LptBFGC system permease protein LptF
MKDKIFWISLVVMLLAVGIIMVIFKDGVTRFTLVMPVFAGFLFWNILNLED